MATWNAIANSPGNTANGMWLMQDGAVLLCLGSDGATLKFLRPDSKGSYANGTWSDAGKFLQAKSLFAAAVLPDGRLVTCGGENVPGLGQVETNFCEIYDPVTKNSKQFQPPAGWTHIGDSPSVVLPDGTFLLGQPNDLGSGLQVALLDAATLTWTFGGGDNDNEQGYVLLQNGGVLTANVYSQTSMRYDLSANAFVQDADLPVMLGGGTEIGPGMALMDGRVIWFGATGHTCIYTPGAEGKNGTWVQGPDLPTMADGTQLVCNDSAAILEPNGKVLAVTWWGTARAGAGIVVFVEYDPVKNAFVVLSGTPKTANREATSMLLLPNGQGLVSISALAQGDDNGLYTVSFDPGAQAVWAPTITFLPAYATPSQTLKLQGLQICGLSECQHFGDDNQQAENYPMVRLIDGTGGVTYLRAHDVSTRSISAGRPGFVMVDIPSRIALGLYYAETVAMGIPSLRWIINIVSTLPPVNITDVGPLVVSTASGAWVNASGTGFLIQNTIDSISLRYDDPKTGRQGEEGPPLTQFSQWFVQGDTDLWLLAPPANQTYIPGIPQFTDPPPRNAQATVVIRYTQAATQFKPPPATFKITYEYLPSASVDVNPPILWTGQTASGIVGLNEPAASTGTIVQLSVSNTVDLTLPSGLAISVAAGRTTNTFPIITAATAKAGSVSLGAAGPDPNLGPYSVTVPICADQFYLDLQGRNQLGVIESGSILTATIYVRNPVGGKITLVTTRTNLNLSIPTAANPDAQGVVALPPFTPTVSAGHIGNFSITVTYGGNTMSFGPFNVVVPIKPPRPVPTPV